MFNCISYQPLCSEILDPLYRKAHLHMNVPYVLMYFSLLANFVHCNNINPSNSWTWSIIPFVPFSRFFKHHFILLICFKVWGGERSYVLVHSLNVLRTQLQASLMSSRICSKRKLELGVEQGMESKHTGYRHWAVSYPPNPMTNPSLMFQIKALYFQCLDLAPLSLHLLFSIFVEFYITLFS